MNVAGRDSSLHSQGGDSHETEKTEGGLYFGQDKEGRQRCQWNHVIGKNYRGERIGAKS